MPDPDAITPEATPPADPLRAPYFALRDPVVYPHCLTPLTVNGEANLAALKLAMGQDRLLVAFPEVPDEKEYANLPFKLSISGFSLDGKSRSVVGILMRVIKQLDFPDGSVRIVVRGVRRVACERLFRAGSGELLASYRDVIESDSENLENENIARQKSLTLAFQELASMLPNLPDELQLAVLNAPSPGRLSDLLADSLNFNYAEKLLLLALPRVRDRLEVLAVLINREIEVMRLGMKIQNDVHEAMSSSQREYYLREQLRAVKEALGEDTRNPDIAELEKRIAAAQLPERVLETVKKELSRLELIPPSAPEYHISYTYINWLLDVPWLTCSRDSLDCNAAEKILDADHYGLEDVKARILEFLAVLQLRRHDAERRAPILCLIGPPGVGKTSLGQSIAKAMGRKFIRFSLGGIRDEAEIRGHRRTYIGAMPGRIIQNLKRAGVCNPVFMLDEIDKLAHDMRGDPAAALLEVLDPEQNVTFNDNYLELDYDLSKVFFIATANLLDTIPEALRDRMEIIRLPGYTAMEKREIARRYLVPRELAECGLNPDKVKFHLPAIDEIIDYYTMEAGVRSLDRTIARVCRRLARRVVSGKIAPESDIKVTPALVRELLGARQFTRDLAAARLNPGCATGMAWTGAGGVILPVEVLAVPGGKGQLKLTGSLGKVMQESAEAAFTLARAHAENWGIDPQYFNTHDFHLHVPDGATPKDGPSAGITMFTALASLLKNRSVRSKLAMTGEITLQGKVTAVGGIREKVTAALRAGEKYVILPEENRKDYGELPEAVRERLEFHFVRNWREVLKIALDGEGENQEK